VQQAIARKTTLDLHPPWIAEKLGNQVSTLLLTLAAEFGIKGIVPGHIKALVGEDGRYAAFSCTRPGRINQKISPCWDESLFRHPSFSLNVVLVNEMTTEAVEDRVTECLEKSFRTVHFNDDCAHGHDHEHGHED
jgi:hypothetical protein